jgi:hypothetical protein
LINHLFIQRSHSQIDISLSHRTLPGYK